MNEEMKLVVIIIGWIAAAVYMHHVFKAYKEDDQDEQ